MQSNNFKFLAYSIKLEVKLINVIILNFAIWFQSFFKILKLTLKIYLKSQVSL